ncbi:lipoyl(octanoyl) transferase LipB [Microbacterium gorillae]|uniref:lipoyl(octanoyl) transferase LipB n=1 Tax=Microbacterium gorillae TaxID=1231063 RepID=UPI00058D0A50|nr:lipoyl(octanoyl) transferase LipB [Microbacterium gorillae]
MDVIFAGFSPTPVPYLDGWRLQRDVHADVVAGRRTDTLILLEHEATYTAGKRTEPHERPQDGTPVIDVDRGGKITWHGPGQLVGYPIKRLHDPVDVIEHVRDMERRLIAALRVHGVPGIQVAGRSGVWVDTPTGQDKVAAIGVRVERGVTMHGFAVNADCDLSGFGGIVPCGITDAGVTTVSRIAGRPVHVRDLIGPILAAFDCEAAIDAVEVPA